MACFFSLWAGESRAGRATRSCSEESSPKCHINPRKLLASGRYRVLVLDPRAHVAEVPRTAGCDAGQNEKGAAGPPAQRRHTLVRAGSMGGWPGPCACEWVRPAGKESLGDDRSTAQAARRRSWLDLRDAHEAPQQGRPGRAIYETVRASINIAEPEGALGASAHAFLRRPDSR